MEIFDTSKQTAMAPAPVGFGSPACGHAFEMTTGMRTFAVRDRQAVKGDMGLAVTAYVPGTSAWRPPSC